MIEVDSLTKRYGDTVAVDNLSFRVEPGIVTGFLGPNGAGKSTTMRMILGLDRPDSGRALVNGRPLAEHRAPLAEMGALLEARAVHPRRSARDHLRVLAATTGIPRSRVEEVIGLVGLEDAAGRPSGGFSLGMGQRLGIATALLGDPRVVMLDEPVNGLDPEGIVWIRHLLRGLASEGRTVLVSSHLMTEMAMTADHFVIVGRGRLIADVGARELEAMAAAPEVRVRTPDATRLVALLQRPGLTVDRPERDLLVVRGADAPEIGERAAGAGVVLHELVTERPSLEEIFMTLTQDAVEYRTHVEGAAA